MVLDGTVLPGCQASVLNSPKDAALCKNILSNSKGNRIELKPMTDCHLFQIKGVVYLFKKKSTILGGQFLVSCKEDLSKNRLP